MAPPDPCPSDNCTTEIPWLGRTNSGRPIGRTTVHLSAEETEPRRSPGGRGGPPDVQPLRGRLVASGQAPPRCARSACRRSGSADDTIVVFTSDHGDMMGSQGVEPNVKVFPWDESVRVPLLVRYPARFGRVGRTEPAVFVHLRPRHRRAVAALRQPRRPVPAAQRVREPRVRRGPAAARRGARPVAGAAGGRVPARGGLSAARRPAALLRGEHPGRAQQRPARPVVLDDGGRREPVTGECRRPRAGCRRTWSGDGSGSELRSRWSPPSCSDCRGLSRRR